MLARPSRAFSKFNAVLTTLVQKSRSLVQKIETMIIRKSPYESPQTRSTAKQTRLPTLQRCLRCCRLGPAVLTDPLGTRTVGPQLELRAAQTLGTRAHAVRVAELETLAVHAHPLVRCRPVPSFLPSMGCMCQLLADPLAFLSGIIFQFCLRAFEGAIEHVVVIQVQKS